MGFNSLFVLVPVGLIVIAFVYVNFIFPQKVEKEKREKEGIENKFMYIIAFAVLKLHWIFLEKGLGQ